MKNSRSMQNLLISNVNNNWNFFSIVTKLPNQKQNNNESSNLNQKKKIIQRNNSALLLTTNNNQLQNLVSSNIPVTYENVNKPIIYNPPIYLNNDVKLSSLNKNYLIKNNPSLKRYNSYENINILNMPNLLNIPLYEEQKNNITNNLANIEIKPIKRVIYNVTNNKNSKIIKNKIKKIPHPRKKEFTYNITNQYVNNNFNNFNYNNFNYNQQILSSRNIFNNLNNYNTISNDSTNNFTNNYLNPSFNSIIGWDNLTQKYEEEPGVDLNLSEFTILNQIGHGGEGGIYIVNWKKNNKNYALKKCLLLYDEFPKRRKKEFLYLKEYIEANGCDGIIKTYGTLCTGNDYGTYDYYELMELADKDWDKEVLYRQQNGLYYEEYELMAIFKHLIKTLSSLQSIHYTHRDIKPQNIMLVNGKFKIGDFGNGKLLKREGMIIQRIRGSELFLSPIIFKGYRSGMQTIKHNTFKSDVFSLGMCFFFAASLTYKGLYQIREVFDMNIIKRTLNQYLGKRYSQNLINLIFNMLQIEENKRPDFTELEVLLL